CFRLLRLVCGSGLPWAAQRLLDESGEFLPGPSVVIDSIEGAPMLAASDLEDGVLQLAAHLARIHALQRSEGELSFLPLQAERLARGFAARPPTLNESLDEGRIRKTLEAVWPLPPTGEPVLMHGDFWPGNII